MKLTCEQCFTKFLTADQLNLFQLTYGKIADVCSRLLTPGMHSESIAISQLQQLGVPLTMANELIACLKDAGVVFGP